MRLDPSTHTIVFKGGCCSALKKCKAMCCKGWDIALTAQEYAGNLYAAEPFCGRDKQRCLEPKRPCCNRGFRLAKRSDTACRYLDNSNRCMIYSIRPLVCRNFNCENGWKLIPVSSGPGETQGSPGTYAFAGSVPLRAHFKKNSFVQMRGFVFQAANKTVCIRHRHSSSCKDEETCFRSSAAITAASLTYALGLFTKVRTIHEAQAALMRKFPGMFGAKQCLRIFEGLGEAGLITFVNVGAGQKRKMASA